MSRHVRVVAALVAVLLATGCGGVGSDDRPNVRVLAASSFVGAFDALSVEFRREHPGIDVEVSYSGSSALARQVIAGAPADIVVTADRPSMQVLVDEAKVAPPTLVARNRLAIAVERGNPHGVGGIRDLGRADLVVVLCAPEVPCGRLATTALDRAGVTVSPRSLEENVKAVASRVSLGEADAGIVYETDVRASVSLEAVPVEGADDPSLGAEYMAAVTTESPDPTAAADLLGFLRSGVAIGVLERSGFKAP